MHAMTETGEAYYRTRDGELAGYLRPADGEDLAVPVSLLGHAMSEPCPRPAAAAILDERGLETLAAAWWARAPEWLDTDAIDLRRPEPDWIWRRFVVSELNATVARVRLQFAPPAELTVMLTVTLPADDVLHAELPE